MSWARWSGDSDVYVYEDVAGGVTCCGCALSADGWTSVNMQTVAEIDAHIRSHRDAGHNVPSYLDENFKQWIAEFPERQEQAVSCGVIW